MQNARSTSSMLLVMAALAMPSIGMAAKVGGSTGSGIRIEQLVMPSGAAQAMATAINEQGTAIVGSIDWTGDQYWYFAARWRRASAESPWQAEDLRPLLPTAKNSEAFQVNDAGTVVVRSEFKDGTYHQFVITSASDTIEVAPNDRPSDLSELDEMVGLRSGEGVRPDRPIYWTSAYDSAVELPVLEDGFGGEAMWFHGADVIGTLLDASGRWLVRWTRSNSQWIVTRIVQVPAAYTVTSMNSGGRLAVNICEPYPCGIGNENIDGAVWDPPYASPPLHLVKRGGTWSRAGRVLEDGRVVGTLITSSSWVPVLWPTLNTFTELPTLSHADSTFLTDGNAFKQLVGHVRLYAARQFQHVAVLWTLP